MSESSLYERMGGEAVLRPMVDDIYELHCKDPLTAPWMSPSAEWNDLSADELKEFVFQFISASTGGPHEYKGRNMVDSHKKIRGMKPFTEASFHTVCYHIISMMKKHNAGGDREIDEVLGFLLSLKSQVMKGTE